MVASMARGFDSKPRLHVLPVSVWVASLQPPLLPPQVRTQRVLFHVSGRIADQVMVWRSPAQVLKQFQLFSVVPSICNHILGGNFVQAERKSGLECLSVREHMKLQPVR